MDSGEDKSDELINRTLEKLQARLLQLDRRNNLLYFKPGKSTVRITGVAPDELVKRLHRARRGLRFQHAPQRSTRSSGFAPSRPQLPLTAEETETAEPDGEFSEPVEVGDIRARRGLRFQHAPQRSTRSSGFAPSRPQLPLTAEETETAEPDGEFSEPVEVGDIQTDCEVDDLQRRLRNLWRRDREWEEERGLNVLFLAVGFLVWKDADGEQVRSPLVLIPSDLERASPHEAFRLHLESDDPVVNSTLRHQLSRMGVDLPELDFESEEDCCTLEKYFASVSKHIAGWNDWYVDPAIVLGTFLYSKLAMYEDFEQMKISGLQSELARLILGQNRGEDVSERRGTGIPRDKDLVGGRLDDLLDIREQFTVLEADSSQLRAIEKARKRDSLVIHGPPGTGKSQTITNLIATMLAEGKHVLFVSEKTAALDVVKGRLEECGLGVFCLDLHSDRSRKVEVYKQIRRALEDEQEAKVNNNIFDQLVGERKNLNNLTRLLHEKQPPLGLSVFEVQGIVARYREYPWVEDLVTPPSEQLYQDWCEKVASVANQVARWPDQFHQHFSSPFRSLRTPESVFRISDLIRDNMERTIFAVQKLRESADLHTQWLGLPAVESVQDARGALKLLELLADAPGIPVAWLDRAEFSMLEDCWRRQEKRQREGLALEEKLDEVFGNRWQSIDCKFVQDAIKLQSAERESLEEVAGPDWGQTLVANPTDFSERVDVLEDALGQLSLRAAELVEMLGEMSLETFEQIQRAVELGDRLLALAPVPAFWLNPSDLAKSQREYAQARLLDDSLRGHEEKLFADFSDEFVGLVDESMRTRYQKDYQNLWRRSISRSYRRDQRLVTGQLKKYRKLSLAETLRAVELALEVRSSHERWSEIETDLQKGLGERYQGRATDWERVDLDIEELRRLISEWRGRSSAQRDILTSVDGHPLAMAVDALRKALSNYWEALEKLARDKSGAAMGLIATAKKVRNGATALRRIKRDTADLIDNLLHPVTDFDELTGIVEWAVHLAELREDAKSSSPTLADKYGTFFTGWETDWSVVARALDWTKQFTNFAEGLMNESLCYHATKPEQSADYASRLTDLESAIGDYESSLLALNERFEISATDWESWEDAPLAGLERWAIELKERADEAPSHLDYRKATQDFDEFLGMGSVVAVRNHTDLAEEVPAIVKRRIFETWLEQVYATKPELRVFTRVNQEATREQFRQLDKELPFVARQRVREQVFRGYPDGQNVKAGQLGILNGELSKKRRQLSVRRLISRIPDVLQAIKPCFLMSPLAVSQYLSANQQGERPLKFDVVIFDEASQVLPEHALPAIEAAQHVIVVGDQHQLPPSTFFQQGFSEDEDNDDDEQDPDKIEGRESILDVMVGLGNSEVAQSYLSVHYRSRSESLIRFSNHAFYENRLLTFPGPDSGFDYLRSVYLPEAIYDAGGSRDNRVEAERVTEIVLELMDELPDGESVGVVALSIAQADLIENLIEQKRLTRSDLDERFREDSAERFFVKNLENVQGDERDHMILSVGYGPTRAGAVPNRFGPINREGGERRLNVAVTRARKSMTVVHSLRPEDITSEAPGARQLRRYLKYVQNPYTSFDAEVTGTGEPESPFEEAVLAELRKRGHIVESQVGVSGYRIDLAIKSKDGERFDLGIECDGAMYHSSPAARDRDWHRQQILENLGWRIHRVWSTSWIKDPQSEIKAIEDALELARATTASELPLVPDSKPSAVQPTVSSPVDIDSPSKFRETGSVAEGSKQFFEEYRHYTGELIGGEPLMIPTKLLARQIEEIVELEYPVHIDVIEDRLRPVLGVRRIGSQIGQHIDYAVRKATSDSAIRRDGRFLWLAGGRETMVCPRYNPERTIEQVADAELDAGILLVAEKTFGAPEVEIVRETARQFGWRRVGKNIEATISQRIRSLLENGRLVLRGEMLIREKLESDKQK